MLRILKMLYDCKIKYILVGGLAINLYGIPRTTIDVDIMIELNNDNILNLINCFKANGFRFRQPIDEKKLTDKEYRKQLKEEKNVIVLTLENPNNPIEVLDLFIDNPIDFNKAYSRKKILKVDDFEIYIASIEDIIEIKKISNRPIDISDIENLKLLKEHEEEL
ncbi:MAG: DUF6036 family nucleotidyltransferase [Candidatus Hydrothermia bacterium]|nr:DUF6036 family nucleotidyltransferase [Candidatus Hydrothermia bacterium]